MTAIRPGDNHDSQESRLALGASYKALLESLPQKIFVKDRNSVYVSCNDNMARDFGMRAEGIVGKTDYDFFPREMADKYRADDARIMETAQSTDVEETYMVGGELAYVETVKTPVRDADGRVVGILGIFWDITARKKLEKELEERRRNLEDLVDKRTADLRNKYRKLRRETSERKSVENLFAAVFTNATVGMYIVQEGKLVLCSPEFEEGIGYSRGELVGRRSLDIVFPEDRDSVREKAIEMLKGRGESPYEYRIMTKTGGVQVVLERVAPVQYHGKRAVLGNFMNITERKRLEEKLEQMATHDALTGLPTRLLFSDRLNLAVESARRRNTRVAVMMIDLDRFKDVNDNLGHDMGDELLKAFGSRLTAVTRKSDTVARLGGDEFVVLASEVGDGQGAREIAARIGDSMAPPVRLNGHTVQVTASIGIAVFPEDGLDSRSLLARADKAMYDAKQGGRNQYRFSQAE